MADPFDSVGSSSAALLLEELPSVPLPVAPRRGRAIGLGGTVAVLAMGALLAAGFGVLGGRPSPSASPPIGGVAPAQPTASEPASSGAFPAPTPGVEPTPQVTPWIDCAEPPAVAPVVQLQVNGRPVDGFVERLASSTEPSPPIEELPGPVSVPVDVRSEVWIAGGACATSWDVGLFGGDVLNQVLNPMLDPAIAAQNRFRIDLAPYAGRDALLRADLFFPDLAVRAIWRISVEPFERPMARLQGVRGQTLIVEGCDVQLTLGNGYEYPREPSCVDDLPFQPNGALVVDREEQLEFGLGDWDVSNGVLICGHLSGETFIAQPEPACVLETSGRSTFLQLPADLEAGEWTLAISTCAFSGSVVFNGICGTWYANVQIRP